MKRPEEIKKELENCSASDACVNCPYDKRDFPYCVQRMIKDAAERIKQLEARLVEANKTSDDLRSKLAEYEKPLVPLTLDEVKALVGVWIEGDGGYWLGSYKPQPALWCGRVNGRFHRFIDESYDYEGEFVFHEEDEYGITWRCWPRKPTDEERKAAKWDEK